MEGKEVRFGITPSSLFATVTTDAGGAVDAMHDSFLPLGGMVLIVNMALGEVTFAALAPDSTACWPSPSSRCSSPGSWSAAHRNISASS